MQSVLPNNVYGLRVAEDLAVCVGEVRHDDETPPRIAPGEAVYPLPRVHKGLSYQGARRPPVPPEATLPSPERCPEHMLGLCGYGGSPHHRPAQAGDSQVGFKRSQGQGYEGSRGVDVWCRVP